MSKYKKGDMLKTCYWEMLSMIKGLEINYLESVRETLEQE